MLGPQEDSAAVRPDRAAATDLSRCVAAAARTGFAGFPSRPVLGPQEDSAAVRPDRAAATDLSRCVAAAARTRFCGFSVPSCARATGRQCGCPTRPCCRSGFAEMRGCRCTHEWFCGFSVPSCARCGSLAAGSISIASNWMSPPESRLDLGLGTAGICSNSMSSVGSGSGSGLGGGFAGGRRRSPSAAETLSSSGSRAVSLSTSLLLLTP